VLIQTRVDEIETRTCLLHDLDIPLAAPTSFKNVEIYAASHIQHNN